jgi:hypothetical protein
MKNKDALLADAVAASAGENPKSVVGDLMMHFDATTVIKIIKVFSGRRINFPKIESIWTHYRNKVVVDTLNLKNTRQIREQLAGFFAISSDNVARIFSQSKVATVHVSDDRIKETNDNLYIIDKDDFVKKVAKSLR